MSPSPSPFRHPQTLAVLILAAGLLAAWLAYAPGIQGSRHFDDGENLAGLAAVHDRGSAIEFIATGVASPIGRPLALASFVPEAYAWPDMTEVFLRTNILIHLINGLLVSWFLYLVSRARREPERKAALIAAISGGLWLLMPLLASSSLLIVQRMTTLAAAFVLLGAVGYLYAREAIERRPLLALSGMTSALGLAAILGILAKENAALLFLYILAMEWALLERPLSVRRGLWRIWFAIVLVAPLLLLAYYLAAALPYPESIVLRREFNGFERLITQAEILWNYLFLAFVPNIQDLGPFHDDYNVRRGLLELPVILSVTAWLVTIAASVLLRKRAPLLAFGVAWYLLGHMLESTTLNLELYYEHRNYLPIVGPVYALVASLAQLAPQWRRLAGAVGAGYAVSLGIVLYSLTSLWGSPRMAAEIWYAYNPSSLRAIEYLAEQLSIAEPAYVVERVLRRYLETNPEAYGIRISALLLSCQLDRTSDQRGELDLLIAELPEAGYRSSIPSGFQQLYQLSRDGQCPSIDKSRVYLLGLSLLENPRYGNRVVSHNIHAILASIGIDSGDLGLAMSHLEKALQASHNPDTLAWAIEILNSAGRYDISGQFLAEARAMPPPQNPLKALRWHQALDRIESRLLNSTPPETADM